MGIITDNTSQAKPPGSSPADLQKYDAEQEIRKLGTVVGVDEKHKIIVYESEGNLKILFNKTERAKNVKEYDSVMYGILENHAVSLTKSVRDWPYIEEFAGGDISLALSDMKTPAGSTYTAKEWQAKLDSYQKRLDASGSDKHELWSEVQKELGKYEIRKAYEELIDPKYGSATASKADNVKVVMIGIEDHKNFEEFLRFSTIGKINFHLQGGYLEEAFTRSLPFNSRELQKMFTLYHEHGHHAKDGFSLREPGADFYAAVRMLQEYPGEATRNFLQAYSDFRALGAFQDPEHGYGNVYAFRDVFKMPMNELLYMNEEEILERASKMDVFVSYPRKAAESNAFRDFQLKMREVTHDNLSLRTPELCLKVLDEMLENERARHPGIEKPIHYEQSMREDMLKMLRDSIERVQKRIENSGVIEEIERRRSEFKPSDTASPPKYTGSGL